MYYFNVRTSSLTRKWRLYSCADIYVVQTTRGSIGIMICFIYDSPLKFFNHSFILIEGATRE
jgi:hypothetical protein